MLPSMSEPQSSSKIAMPPSVMRYYRQIGALGGAALRASKTDAEIAEIRKRAWRTRRANERARAKAEAEAAKR
jgi:hypothetical protein